MRRFFGSLVALLTIALTTFTVSRVYAGNDLGAALAGSEMFGYGKLMYVVDDKKGGRLDQSTAGGGGKLGVKTGAYYGFQFLGAGYVTSDFGLRHSDPRRTDAYMFDLDKQPYSLLGEAQLIFQAGQTTLTAGRQEFFSPIINTYEYRIIPNLFEGYTLVNRDLPQTNLTLAYLTRMSGLDGLVSYSEFHSMSQQAYTSLLVTPDGRIDARQGDTLDPSRVVGERGVWVAGLAYDKQHRFQLWNFHGKDLVNTGYFDTAFRHALNADFSSVLEFQAYRTTATGRFKQYLAQHGLNASYGLAGVKGTLSHRPSGLSISLAANKFTGDAHTVTAAGNWGGYPEFVGMPYLYAEKNGTSTGISAIANSQLAKLTLLLDLAAYGWSGHSVLFGHAQIDTDAAIIRDSDIRVNSLLYRGKLTPKMSLRIAAEARSSGNARYDNEFLVLSVRYDW